MVAAASCRQRLHLVYPSGLFKASVAAACPAKLPNELTTDLRSTVHVHGNECWEQHAINAGNNLHWPHSHLVR